MNVTVTVMTVVMGLALTNLQALTLVSALLATLSTDNVLVNFILLAI
jgi:hypothetical protein